MPVIQVDSVSQASSFRKSPESDFASSSSSSSSSSDSSSDSISVISMVGLGVVKETGLSQQDKSFNEKKQSDSLGDINLPITPQKS
jgi:hypothetical protein